MSKSPSPLTVPRQEFFIPIHGYVRLSAKEVAVVNHPAFQRLRRTRQLGFAHLVFPGGIHTRFEHSLGTVHVAQRMVEHVNLNHQADSQTDHGRPTAPIGSAHCELIRLAALLHDIGHLPFGHTLEDELGHLPSHDGASRLYKVSSRSFPHYVPPAELVAMADAPGQEAKGESDDTQWPLHALVDLLYADTVAELGISKPPFEVICAIITKPPKTDEERETWNSQYQDLYEKFNLELCQDIVGNTICADFLDYLYRDWHHLGKPLYEDTRIYQYMEARQIPSDDQKSFGDDTPSHLEFVINIGSGEKIRHDALTSILELLEGRYKLAETVLFHRSKLAVTGLLDRCLLEIADLYQQAKIPTGLLPDALEDLLLDASDDMLPDLLLRLTNGGGVPHIEKILLASIAESRKAADNSLSRSEDLLPKDSDPSSEVNVESPIEQRQRSIGTLINSLRDRVVYRMLYKLKLSDFPVRHDTETWGPERVLEMYRPSNKRREFLDGLERLCELPEHSLVMYCPPTEMNAKVAKVKLLIEKKVISFDAYDFERKETSLTRGALWSQINRFSELWSTQIFLRTDVWDALSAHPATAQSKGSGQTLLDQLKNVVSTFLYRLDRETAPAIQRMNIESSIRAITNGVALPQAARANTENPLTEHYQDLIFPSGLPFTNSDSS